MPQLNVMSWNSTGETPAGATALQQVINYVVGNGWTPHVIVIQEANVAPGGSIYTMLAGLGANYNQPPAHATEGGPGGRGYILLTHTSVGGQATFARANLPPMRGCNSGSMQISLCRQGKSPTLNWQPCVCRPLQP